LRTARFARCWVVVPLVAAAGYWLFADTLAHHFPDRRRRDRVRFTYWGGFTDHRMWREIIDAFEASHPGLHVAPEWLPLSGYATKIDQQMVAGDAPDVMLFQDEPFPRYAREQFADLGPLLANDGPSRDRLDDCWPTAVSSFQHEGKLHGLPVNGGNVLIYCNLDAFARASAFHNRPIAPPRSGWTLDEFVSLCLDLTLDEDGDGEPEQFALLQPHWVYYLPFIWSHGASLLDETRSRWTLQGPEAIAAFTLYADLRHRHRVTPAPIEYAGQNSDTAFLSGRVAMCVNGPWFQPFLNETAMATRYRVVNIPEGPGGSATRVTWDGVCLYAKLSETRRTNAWRFARFLLTREAQTVFAAYQRAVPARRAFSETYVRLGGGSDSAAAMFINAMKTARLQPITPAWQTMHYAMRRHLISVILDGDARRAPEAAIRALAGDRDINAAFGGMP